MTDIIELILLFYFVIKNSNFNDKYFKDILALNSGLSSYLNSVQIFDIWRLSSEESVLK
jgi:hypothetical protein